MKKAVFAAILAALLAGLCGCSMMVVEDTRPVVIACAANEGMFT